MTDNNQNKLISLAHAKELVATLEAGDNEQAELILDQMALARDSDLFKELGKLTRELHDSLSGMHADSRIADLAEKDIPDAKERLNYVVTVTEQAAHKTLNVVEECLPVAEKLQANGKTLRDSWQKFRKKEMSSDDFRSLCLELDEFFDEASDQMSSIHKGLSDVLLAQDYQDITGQIIRRVIGLVQEVEGNLVSLVRITGQRMVASGDTAETKEEDDKIKAVGPAVPGVDTSDVVSNQDDVDDLLSSLGF
jgi:chemotaxis protein CheZ